MWTLCSCPPCANTTTHGPANANKKGNQSRDMWVGKNGPSRPTTRPWPKETTVRHKLQWRHGAPTCHPTKPIDDSFLIEENGWKGLGISPHPAVPLPIEEPHLHRLLRSKRVESKIQCEETPREERKQTSIDVDQKCTPKVQEPAAVNPKSKGIWGSGEGEGCVVRCVNDKDNVNTSVQCVQMKRSVYINDAVCVKRVCEGTVFKLPTKHHRITGNMKDERNGWTRIGKMCLHRTMYL